MVTFKQTALLGAMCFLPLSGAFAAADADMQAILNKLNALSDRVESLEQENKSLRTQLESAPPAASNLPVPFPGAARPAKDEKYSMTIPGTDTTVKLGGYVKADTILDVGSSYGGDFARFASIPLDGSSAADDTSQFHMHARNTRFNLTTTTPSVLGDIKTFAEIDFYGTRGSDLVTNGHAPQLRQAYGQVGGLLAGQTWSNFMDLALYPESLDFVGPAGITLLRQTQVRWSDTLGDGLSYSISAENPNADFTNGSTDAVSSLDRAPDVVAGLNQNTSWGMWSARALLRDISVKNNTTGDTDSAFGLSGALGARINTVGKDNLKLRATYGNGMGRYIYDIATSAQSSAYNNGELDAQTGFAGYASYQHYWTDTLRSNFMGGYVWMDNETSLIGQANNETIWSGHANLIWEPVPQYKVGLEYIHGERELDNGTDGQLDRFMASFIYNLN
jgi:hypothetical protein